MLYETPCEPSLPYEVTRDWQKPADPVFLNHRPAPSSCGPPIVLLIQFLDDSLIDALMLNQPLKTNFSQGSLAVNILVHISAALEICCRLRFPAVSIGYINLVVFI